MLQLITLADLIKPIIHLVYIVLLGSVTLYAVYSLSKRFDMPLLLIVVGGLIGLMITTIWFIFGIHTQWKITLLPVEVRRALYLFIQICYPFEIIIWVSAVFLLVRRNCSLPPKLPKNES